MPSAAPAHALLSAAHALLRPAFHHGRDDRAAEKDKTRAVDKKTAKKDKTKAEDKKATDKGKTRTEAKKVTENDKTRVEDKKSAENKAAPEKTQRFSLFHSKDKTPTEKTKKSTAPKPDADPRPEKPDVETRIEPLLPIERAMPSTVDATDLRDLVDAINSMWQDEPRSVDGELRDATSAQMHDQSEASGQNQDYVYGIPERKEIPHSDYAQDGYSSYWNQQTDAILQSETIMPEQIGWSLQDIPEMTESGFNIAQGSQIGEDDPGCAEEYQHIPESIHRYTEVAPAVSERSHTCEVPSVPERTHQTHGTVLPPVPPRRNLPVHVELAQATSESLPGQVDDVTDGAPQTEEVTSDGEPALNWEGSECYYTASSEVSLVSDPDRRLQELDDSNAAEMLMSVGTQEKEECVVAGHVAAMREKFESLTRSTTPCVGGTPSDLSRNASPTQTFERS